MRPQGRLSAQPLGEASTTATGARTDVAIKRIALNVKPHDSDGDSVLEKHLRRMLREIAILRRAACTKSVARPRRDRARPPTAFAP